MRTRTLFLSAALVSACGASTTPPPSPPPLASASTSPVTSAAPVTSPTASASASATPPAPLPPDAQALVASPSHAFDYVSSLTDEVGPRLAGSKGDAAGVAWAARAMAATGATNVETEKAMVPRWERGAESAEIVSPVAQPMRVTALGGSVATPPGGIEADVLEVPSLAELKKLGPGAATGKIVFIDAPTPRTRDGKGYGQSVGGRHGGAAAAQKVGAVAMVLRSAGTDSNRLPHTGAKSTDAVEIPAAALSAPDADLLHRTIEQHKSARMRLVLATRTLPDVPSANVIGEVRGREVPDEVVLLGAHLDSWDLGTGALDDGAGCAIVLDVLARIAALPHAPRRTVRGVLFANEERGRNGAYAYQAAHKDDAGKHVVAIEADLGADKVYAVSWLGAPEASARFDALATLLAPLGVEKGGADASGGADVALMRELGVPVLELEQDATRYFDIHHSANDTLDKVDPDAIAQAATAFALATWGAAEQDGDFGRVPEGKRKRAW